MAPSAALPAVFNGLAVSRTAVAAYRIAVIASFPGIKDPITTCWILHSLCTPAVWQGQAGDDPSPHATAQQSGLLQRLQQMGGAAALQSELDARVAWQLPNDLRLDILGRRSATKIEGADITSMFSRPWFVPRTLGDSIRLLGESGGARAAPHPLAPGADQLYRYAAGDSVVIASAVVPTLIAGYAFLPRHLLPKDKTKPVLFGEENAAEEG